FATIHCDGTPIIDGAQMVRVSSSVPPAPQIDWNNNLIVPDAIQPVSPQDANFDGTTASIDSPFRGFNDWNNVDLLQVGSRENALGFSAGSGVLKQVGGGGGVPWQVGGAGGVLKQVGGGGGVLKQVGGGGGTDQDEDTAFSSADPPTGLNCKVPLGVVPA